MLVVSRWSVCRRNDGPTYTPLLVTGYEGGRWKTLRYRTLYVLPFGHSAGLVADISVQIGGYYIDVRIGTPGKKFTLHLDTGSADTWVNTPDLNLCSSRSRPCDFSGTYQPNASSTYEYVNDHFDISYVDGSGAKGEYAADAFLFGYTRIKLDRLQFGIGHSSTNAQGLVGLGYAMSEVQTRAGLPPYNNLPAQMAVDGLINSNAYSIWLNDLDSPAGTILFGGVDPAKYEGDLITLPVQTAQNGEYRNLMVTLTGLTFHGDGNGDNTTQISEDNLALAVLLDTGSTLTYLHNDLVEPLYDAIGVTIMPNPQGEQTAYVPCSFKDRKQSLVFTFSSQLEISVPMDELVLNQTTDNKTPRMPDGVTDACLFGIQERVGAGSNTLGDTFLRSAYVVFDLDNNEISMAQTKFNATTTAMVEIKKGKGGVPGAKMVDNAVQATSGFSDDQGGIYQNAASGQMGVGRGMGTVAWGLLVGVAMVFMGL
ncbi:aspartic peptidase domain-containing protein [Sordaria brevicollis]|uniref:Aspartic peptidase domain-containing protein n=1 Tax=Sordaria brevicollis TaxID=83679 RepID=A0AAE0U5Q3_SORBR|nr:aspartic peptidase domain-containing protein [Sordaria brevicollis]